jgi:hypothetical protein
VKLEHASSKTALWVTIILVALALFVIFIAYGVVTPGSPT